MILLAALLLADVPAAKAADAFKPIASAKAIGAFKALCWDSFREVERFHAALAASPIALAPAPRRQPEQQGELHRGPEGALTYVASDSLPPGIPPRQCSLRVLLVGHVDQLTLAAMIVDAYKLPPGRTKTSATQSISEWNVVGEDGRTARLLAISRETAGGRTELKLSALLLAEK